jgi:CheY-like chemotaxis protein
MPHALIIDDDANNADILASLLEDESFSSTIINQPTTLEAILAQPNAAAFDIVFVDLEMPGVNGYGVLATLKANPKFANVPIVAHSVHLNELAKTNQQGFDSFIGKPINFEAFPSYLAKIFNGDAVWEVM